MSNSISATSSATQAQQAQKAPSQQAAQAAKTTTPDQQDTVTLSKQASGGDAAQGDPDHDGH